MTESELLSRLGGTDGNREALRALARQLGTGEGIVPFVGAGLSAPFGYPPWTDFLREAARRAGAVRRVEALIRAGGYEEAAEVVIDALGAAHFQYLIEDTFGDERVADGPLAGAVTLLPRLANGPVITTNFDRVLERAFREARCPFEDQVWHARVNVAVRALPRRERVLLKLHGDWKSAEQRVLTLSEYKQFYGAADDAVDFALPLPGLFRLLATHPVLFLGCSLREDRTMRVLHRLAVELPTSRHYAIVERPRGRVKSRERGRHLSEHNIRPIWYPEGEHGAVEDILRFLAEQVPDRLPRPAAPRPPGGARSTPASAAPAAPSSFVGREAELAELAGQLGEARLLTITGPPGVGKTRVAIELLKAVAERFDSSWFVELSQLWEPSRLPQRVATVVDDGREPAHQPPTDALVDRLSPGRFLLVLDNCEHLRAACAALSDELLRRCPQLAIVATSREQLHVAGERRYALPPMSLPDLDPTRRAGPVAASDAVTLFARRAADLCGFEVTPENERQVARLVHELEGNPLAIELMAAWAGSLTLEEMLQWMADENKLDVLTGGAPSEHGRQWVSLRQAIELSYRLLDEEHRHLFAHLGVFSRGCTAEAAAHVCGTGRSRLEVRQLLEHLRSSSLVIPEEGRSGSKRFRLLDFVRAFARERLGPSLGAIEERHATWYLDLAERAAPELLRGDQQRWLDVLTEDIDNVRAAINWSVREGRADVGLRLVIALWRLAEIRGYLGEGRERVEEVLAMPGVQDHPELRSKASSGAGMLAYRQGDMAAAARYFETSLAIERDRGDGPGMANAYNDLGNVAQMRARFDEARRYYEQSLELERQAGNRRGVAVTQFNLGNCARRSGELDDAEGHFLASVEGFEGEGNRREAAFPLNGLAQVALARGALDEARSYSARSLAIREELSDQKGIADSTRTSAGLELAGGDVRAALELFVRSLKVARDMGDLRGVAESSEGVARAATATGDFGAAVELVSAAGELRARTSVLTSPLEQEVLDEDLARARAALGPGTFERHRRSGLDLVRGARLDTTAIVETAEGVSTRAAAEPAP